jgi:tetratricopeptide (TPR) repeat protein
MGQRAGVAATLANLGLCSAERGEWADARQYYYRCLHVAEEINDRYKEAHALGYLGTTFRHTRQWREGMEVLQRALAINRASGYEQQLGSNLREIALIGEGMAESVTGEERCEMLRKARENAREALSLLTASHYPDVVLCASDLERIEKALIACEGRQGS